MNSLPNILQKALFSLSRPAIGSLLLILGATTSLQAQVCSGSFGDPVINITFGSGNNPGPSLLAATTAYQFTSTTCPGDGFYTITNSTFSCFGNTWHSFSSDHTGNRNGYFMLINASFQPSDFYLDTVKGLCASTTYRFGAWIANMLQPGACSPSPIRPNVTFSIESTTGTVLQFVNTGNIVETSGSTWQEYSLDFTVPAGVTDIVLRMTNNSVGGCGNDLALDDITFRACGPKATAGITGTNGSSSTQFCIDGQSTLQFDGAVSTGYLSPSYQWQVSTDTGATWVNIAGQTNTTYIQPPVTTAGLYEYRLAVGDGSNILLPNCHVSSNVITVTVNPKPVPAAKNDGPVCENKLSILSADGGGTYSWTGPNGYTASGQSVSVPSAKPSDAGDYHVLVTSAAGCAQTDVTTLVVYPAPAAAFNTSAPACENTDLLFIDQSTVTGQTTQQWNWDFGDGTTDNIQNPTHKFPASGSFPVSLIVTTDKGCSNLAFTRSVIIHDLPRPDFSLPEICLADPQAQFYDSSHIADGTENAFSYSWDFGDGGTGNIKNPTHHYTAAGPYNVKLTVRSGDGCIKDTVKTFTVNGDNPIAAFTVNNLTLLCANAPTTLTDASSVSPGRIIKTEIYWDYGNDPTNNLIEEDPVAGEQYPHSYPYFSSPATKTYQVRYIAWSGQTCMQETTQVITLNASPATTFAPPPPVCEEVAPYLITQGNETQGFTGSGLYSGRGIDGDGLFSPRVATPGIDTLHYTFTGANGCIANSDQIILVYPQPHADAGPTEYFLEGGVLTLDGNGSGNNITYAWSPADSILDDPHIAHPRVSPHDDIVFTLKVTSSDGCVDSASVQVIVLKIPIVPNAFSPNGDGINDTWVIRYLDEYPGADVQVFNRYGQPVFHAIGYSKPWDGTYNGHPLPVATYYWIIDPKNGRKQFNGSVTILR